MPSPSPHLPMVQIMVARVVKISTARVRVRTVNRSDSQKILSITVCVACDYL